MDAFACLLAGPTVVQVAKVPSVEEEVRSEEVPEAPPAWPKGQGGIKVEATGPVGLSSQEVTCGTSNICTPTAKPTDQLLPGCLQAKPGACNTFTLWTQTIHAESSDASGTPQVEPEGSTPIGHLINSST